MGKKKRKTKITVFGCLEGNIRERAFLEAILNIYQPHSNNINYDVIPSSGGTPDKIVSHALNQSHRGRSFAWFDEDFEPKHTLTKDIRIRLEKHWFCNSEAPAEFFACPLGRLQAEHNADKRNPILIVSQPVCVESLILKVLDQNPPYEHYDPTQRSAQIKKLKDTLAGIIGNTNEAAFYKERLTKGILEDKRAAIEELDLLISMFCVPK